MLGEISTGPLHCEMETFEPQSLQYSMAPAKLLGETNVLSVVKQEVIYLTC